MSTPDDPITLAYQRLWTDSGPRPPGYVYTALVAAVPELNESTPVFCSATHIENDYYRWEVLAIDGRRLIRINILGDVPPVDRRDNEPLPQAAEQDIQIEPLEGSVKSVKLKVTDTSSRYPSEDVSWQTQWRLTFADDEWIMIPGNADLKYVRARESAEAFMNHLLPLVLPR